MEFLKDQLVPAVWMNDSSGAWTTLSNWNSGQTPIAPVTGPGQVTPVGTQTLPTARLPGASGSGVTSGQHDTVILERPNANITVTLSSGTHNLRKLYMREALNISGGSLTVNYAPAPDSTTNGAQFSGPVTLSGGSFSVHTLQVDAARTFTLNGGTFTFNTVNLMPGATPARILVSGGVSVNALSNSATAIIANGSGAGNSGLVELAGGATHTVTVADGPADVDLSVDVPIHIGGLNKAGLGTMRVTAANAYSVTTISAGRLLVNNTSGSGTGSGAVTVNGGTLAGTGTIAGAVTVNSGGTISPGTSIGTLTLHSTPIFSGTNFMEIDRNGGAPLADKIVLTSGTLTYDGTLVVTNAGAPLTGGEVFPLFNAPAYAGAFASSNLPSLNAGLNWDASNLTLNGSLKVNRSPVAGPTSFTNAAPPVLQIPIATLISNATDADGDPIALGEINLTTTNGVTLTTNDSFIIYSNSVSVADEFSYTLTDGHGGSASGTVQIVASPTGRFAAAPSSTGEALTLQFIGSPGWIYFLERSTNLPNWITIWTNIAPANGLFDYTDTFNDLAEPPPSAFYRLRWAP